MVEAGAYQVGAHSGIEASMGEWGWHNAGRTGGGGGGGGAKREWQMHKSMCEGRSVG